MDGGNKELLIATSLNPEHPEVLAFTNRTYGRNEWLYRSAVDFFGRGDYEQAAKSIKTALLGMLT